MSIVPVLIAGEWRPSAGQTTFQAENPATGEPLPPLYPISPWSDCEAALAAAATAAVGLRRLGSGPIATALRLFAERIERRSAELVELAHLETGLPKSPRLADVELPRTTSQLRQAATAAEEGTWAEPTIDTKLGIRSYFAPLGPVCVFGPNNFPFAFGSASGGDFAAALAAGNPVIAKANSSHPGTTRLFAEEALQAMLEAGLPPATVQLLYRTSHADGERLVADPRVGATGYTGSRSAGLKLKTVADAAGKPIYLELSSINPVLILPGAIAERGDKLAEEFTGSCLMGTGQFCTNPGLVIVLAGEATERLIADVASRFTAAPNGVLLSKGVAQSLDSAVSTLVKGGAQLLAGGKPVAGPGYRFQNTLLRIDAARFLADPHTFQTEAFGNESLWVVAQGVEEVERILDSLEGNLTGCIYSDTRGSDDRLYDQLAPRLRPKVGRLMNDKMPTGVAVSPAMNHGGPFPATGHPGFTAVGIPAALRRFALLECYDGVRPARLPALLGNVNPGGRAWRWIDGRCTQENLPG